jgi:hypothetical protein
VVLRIPALENVDPAGVKRIGGLHEIKAPSRSTSVANDVRVRGEKGCSVDWIKDQAAGDDQHKAILGNWLIPSVIARAVHLSDEGVDPDCNDDRMADLSGRIALVTGASSGLGERFAEILRQARAEVVATARRAERLEQLPIGRDPSLWQETLRTPTIASRWQRRSQIDSDASTYSHPCPRSVPTDAPLMF